MRLFNTCILVAAAIGLLVLWGVFLSYYSRLPESIPTHFGLSGVADGWGSKATVLLYPLLGLGIYAVTLIFHYLVFPWQRRTVPIVESLALLVLAELIWFWSFLQWQTIHGALEYAPGLGSGFNILLGMIVATTIALLVCVIATRDRNK